MSKADVEAIKQSKDGLDVWPDIERYAADGYSSIDPADFVRMRWFGIYQQQPNEGHFMLRVKIPSGDFTSNQLRAVAHVANTWGRGIADITTRQNFQFHWLRIEDIPPTIAHLNAAGLTTVGACGDITRNVCGCPVAGVDPNEIYDTRELVRQVTAFFLGNKDFSDLPRKYKMSISGCAIHCNQPEINDLGIQAVRRTKADGTTEIGFHARVGGGLSTQPHFAQKLDIFIRPDQVLDVCRAVTEIFRDEGYRKRRNHARLKFLVADWGVDKFREELIRRLDWTPEPALLWAEPSTVQQDHLGVHAQKQDGHFWIGTSVITGRVTGKQLQAAADIADKYCSGSLRTSNQQNLLFPNISSENLEAAKAAIRSAGFEWEVTEFHKGAVSCTGNEFCNLAITETKAKLREVVAHLESELLWDEPIRIHLNGCPNSCGQHHIGDIGLQGCLARLNDGTQVEAYDVGLGGRLGADSKFVRAISRKVPADKLKFALANLLRAFRAERIEVNGKPESFGKFVDRHTDAQLGSFLGLDLLAQDDPNWTPPPPRSHGSSDAE